MWFIITTVIGFIATPIFCGKKKSGSAKAKSSGSATSSTPKSAVQKPAAASVSEKKEVVPSPAPMQMREADDNETLNDAPADWGPLPNK